jgi:ABC-type polysaccharide/polyol phosphate export permease
MKLAVFADQTLALTAANMKSRYRDTLTGLLWVILNPLIMYGAQSLVFSRILHVAIPYYSLFLLLGLLPWLFINQSVQMTATLLVHSASFLKAYNVHPLVLVAANVLDNFANFVLAFVVVLLPALFFSEADGHRFLLLLGPAFLLAVFTLATCWLISVLHVFYRDTAFVMTFVLNVSFFLTPIFYSASMVDEKYRWLIKLNLIYLVIRPFQSLVYSADASFGESSLVALAVAGGMAGLVALLWRWRKNEFYSCL